MGACVKLEKGVSVLSNQQSSDKQIAELGRGMGSRTIALWLAGDVVVCFNEAPYLDPL